MTNREHLFMFFQHILYEKWPQKRYFEGLWIDIERAFPLGLPLKAYRLAEKERTQLANRHNQWHQNRYGLTQRVQSLSLTGKRNILYDEEYIDYDSPSKYRRWVQLQCIVEPIHQSKKAASNQLYTFFDDYDIYDEEDIDDAMSLGDEDFYDY
jgi:hypothetical protein